MASVSETAAQLLALYTEMAASEISNSTLSTSMSEIIHNGGSSAYLVDYDLSDADVSMGSDDQYYSILELSGTLTTDRTFTLYFDSDSDTSKIYHIWVNALSSTSAGNTITITTGVSGKTSVDVVIDNTTDPYLFDILVDTEGNIISMQINASGDTSSADVAGSADKLSTARVITLSGDATGDVAFDGSEDVTLDVAVVDDSHNHIIDNVDGLQDALDAKEDTLTFDSAPTSGSTNPVTSGGLYSALADKADLVDGTVPASQLPSYVDSVVDSYIVGSTAYASDWLSDSDGGDALTPESDKIYVVVTSGDYENKTYRWSGSLYVEISESLALGETSSTAYRGDRGLIAYTHSQLTSGNPHNVTADDVGLGSVDNTADADKSVATAEAWATARSFYISDSTEANTGASVSVDGSGDVTLLLPSTIEGTFYSGSKLLMTYYTVDLSDLSTSNFYPVTFGASNKVLDCEIHSPGLLCTADYNQNLIHFQMIANGWSDTPKRFDILQYGVYDASEITIGCIGYGTAEGERCVWLRGGMSYTFYCNAVPTYHSSDYSYGSSNTEIYTVGTNYYGGTNTNVTMVWEPDADFTSYHYGSHKISSNLTVSGTITGTLSGTATYANYLGTSTVGSSTKPIYLSSGTATASTSTVGSSSTPVYLNAGTITACTSITASAATTAYNLSAASGYCILPNLTADPSSPSVGQEWFRTDV